MKNTFKFATIILAGIMLAACGTGGSGGAPEDDPVTCASGEILKNGQCVVDTSISTGCDKGEEEVNGLCVPTDECEDGETPVDGECVNAAASTITYGEFKIATKSLDAKKVDFKESASEQTWTIKMFDNQRKYTWSLVDKPEWMSLKANPSTVSAKLKGKPPLPATYKVSVKVCAADDSSVCETSTYDIKIEQKLAIVAWNISGDKEEAYDGGEVPFGSKIVFEVKGMETDDYTWKIIRPQSSFASLKEVAGSGGKSVELELGSVFDNKQVDISVSVTDKFGTESSPFSLEFKEKPDPCATPLAISDVKVTRTSVPLDIVRDNDSGDGGDVLKIDEKEITSHRDAYFAGERIEAKMTGAPGKYAWWLTQSTYCKKNATTCPNGVETDYSITLPMQAPADINNDKIIREKDFENKSWAFASASEGNVEITGQLKYEKSRGSKFYETVILSVYDEQCNRVASSPVIFQVEYPPIESEPVEHLKFFTAYSLDDVEGGAYFYYNIDSPRRNRVLTTDRIWANDIGSAPDGTDMHILGIYKKDRKYFEAYKNSTVITDNEAIAAAMKKPLGEVYRQQLTNNQFKLEGIYLKLYDPDADDNYCTGWDAQLDIRHYYSRVQSAFWYVDTDKKSNLNIEVDDNNDFECGNAGEDSAHLKFDGDWKPCETPGDGCINKKQASE